MRAAWRSVRLLADIVRGVVLGLLLSYAIYKILFMDVAGPLFRYAGY